MKSSMPTWTGRTIRGAEVDDQVGYFGGQLMVGFRHSLYIWIAVLVVWVWLLHGCGSQEKRVSSHTRTRQDMVMIALSQIDTPYRLGQGIPDAGFDCSGLVQYVHRSVGIGVPRMAQEQLASASPVWKSAVQAGDLVFFRIADGRYHVGIMVDGNRFVHAPGVGKGVRVAELNTPYWAERYLSAGNFLP